MRTPTPHSPLIEIHVSPPLETNAYLVADPKRREALAIDPSLVGRELLDRCNKQGWALKTVVLTHGHIDHTHDAAFLVRETGAGLLAHCQTAPLLSDPMLCGAAWLGMNLEPCELSREIADGDMIEVGDFSMKVLHTPGHSPGCVCLLGDGYAFTGDLLFAGGVGRWDFPGGDQEVLIKSLRRVAREYPDETRLYSGHGPATTMDQEKRTNPFLVEWGISEN